MYSKSGEQTVCKVYSINVLIFSCLMCVYSYAETPTSITQVIGDVTMKTMQCFKPNSTKYHLILSVYDWYSPCLQTIYLAIKKPRPPQEIMYYVPLYTWGWVCIRYNSNSFVNICIKVGKEVNVYQVLYGTLSVYDAKYKYDCKIVRILL
jgi:hypothetical protein